MKTKLHFVLSLTIFLTLFSVSAQQSYWQKADKKDFNANGNTTTIDQKFYQIYQLDIDLFKAQLTYAPLRSVLNAESNSKVYIPNVNGELEQFRVVKAPVLSDELAQLHPNINTYIGYSTENPGTRVRFSVTPHGLQSMVTYPNAPLNFVVPFSKTDQTTYIIYSRAARTESLKDFECFTEDVATSMDDLNRSSSEFTSRDANDQQLRTFRIAISTTGEYTNFWDDGDAANGNAQEDALAQLVSTLNRTNEVFEVDMAVTFILVSGTEIIYADPSSDPYTGDLNDDLQSTLTSVVGEANYDIGHLFDFGSNSGNAGCIGCVCLDGSKGSGFSSHQFTDNDGGPYMSDFFDIDYVPHEIGHQMGANHTWSFSNEGIGVNVEPGSGTTVMGYAGIRGNNDVQDHSDPYFHYFSILQILDNLNNRTCWVGSAITNNAPIADAGLDYTIPIGTAFVLKGNAIDIDASDVLTYTWEQIDNGTTTFTNFGPNKTSGALWRSRPPTTETDRFMPILERVISGALTETNPVETTDNSSWETVSNVSRALNFALTVRDRSEANGVGQTPQSDFDTMTVNVNDAAGPFVVTSQSINETWDVGSSQTITWDVAGTDSGAVNTPTVNVLLSIDGGFTYPFELATNIPNDGEQVITVPIIGGDSTTVRVKVEGNNHIFYAINPINFTIEESEFVLNILDTTVDICSPDDAVFNFTYNTFLGFTGTTIFSASGLPPEASVIFTPTTATDDDTDVIVTVSGIGGLAIGNYFFTIIGSSGSITKTIDVLFNVFDSNLESINVLTPQDGAIDLPADEVVFTWTIDNNAATYEIDIATDFEFNTMVEEAVVNEGSYTATTLNSATDYFWRVRSSNDCGTSVYFQSNFTTANIFCSTYDALDIPLDIPDNNAAGVNSVITIPLTIATITDINVTVNLTHNWTEDLVLKLIAPDGTEVVLSSNNGANGDNYTSTVFDSNASTLITEASAPFTGSFQPEGDLSQFNGSTLSGDWALNVSDTIFFITGSLDSWSIGVCEITTLSNEVYNGSNAFRIFPNPNEGSFNVVIDNPTSKAIAIMVFDINGRQIFKTQFTSEANFNKRINLEHVASGIYLVKIKDGINLQYQKIIVN